MTQFPRFQNGCKKRLASVEWIGEINMNGADDLCDTLIAHSVDVCFANPGTSEMHFVAALDRKPQMRCILGLFEGVVTGAADGYARMAGKPAAALLHTGPGLANGLANLHNARRAFSPVVTVVGDHASYHLDYDAPLTSDIESLALPMSEWVYRVKGADDVAHGAAAACEAAQRLSSVATMILPADAAWGETRAKKFSKATPVEKPVIDNHEIKAAVKAILTHPARCGILLDGEALHSENLDLLEQIAASHNVELYAPVFISRLSRGAGRPALKRIPYPVDEAVAMLAHLDVLILVGAIPPVAFFAYPGKPSALTPKTCKLISLASVCNNIPDALARLGDALGVSTLRRIPKRSLALKAVKPTGKLTEDAVAVLLAQTLPDQAIISDEALTSARRFYALSESAPPHDYMMVTGGAIGVGIPLSTGAAVACPHRKVIALQADGSGMYTLQGLWTQARERLDVVTIILNNRGYAILQHEMKNVGVPVHGGNAERMMRIDDPGLDWVSLAAGMGVEGARAETCTQFADLLTLAFRRAGPFLIEAMI